ncbi:hypothetical protein BU25DRAFT_121638 [Macroventuria anomochaeta]|uniref:Uncharacterized protein n=1 Tax=Macroventuria anomochaeta TaxID=301207 RepID=A0ACB6RUE9_9PLEO|nr:uncharacterized protein BU25DRAFT_121638 [Macroventuria anomochaeta]KAF2625399.1 hypothetical protein BU25DRAFT_121638 [Macroventuria anomochaeta]
MARLNEPPVAAPQPSADNIEVVKRRFLRQNRELAKTNSQQSMRIRTLESDCSRLLAENLALRERAMHLQHTVDKQSSSLSFENIDAVRSQLEAKMQELGSLVASLGQPKQTERRRKSQQLARHRPQERNFRSGLCIQEVEERMMPTIDEDKDHPRRTMNAEEIRNVLEDPESQSPDIGPPPTSSFEVEEPIAFDPNPEPDEHMEDVPAEDEPALPMNLETRKKRRESGPKLNIRRISVFESSEEAKEKAAKPMRTGAKRKFSVQEDEDRPETQDEQFNFNRRNVQEAETEEVPEEPRAVSPARPVLSSKPVNTDPVLSPKKQRSSVKEQEKPQKKKLPSVNPRSRQRLPITRTITPPELPMLVAPEPVPVAEINLDLLPPKTPAADTVFSPPSTEPSTSRPDNKDTPPPGDVSSGNQTGQAGRPSRRARPQVSYKEPSLAVKMRRDGKMADAIVPQTDRRTSVEVKLAPLTTGRVAIKREAEEEEAEVGSPSRQKLDRRENASPPDPAPMSQSMTSRAISALIDQTSTANRRVSANFVAKTADEPASEPVESSKPAVKEEAVEEDNLAIFDFNGSSPVDSARPRTDLAKVVRSARRHSSVPALVTSESAKPEGSLPSLHKRTGSGTIKSTSTTSLARSTSAARLNAKKASVPTSTSAKSDNAAVGDAEKASATCTLRAERIASRRKSMML